MEAILILLGFIVGLIGAVAGVGGGFFIMPYLLIVWAFPPAQADATSLSIIFLNALSATTTNLTRRSVDVKTGLHFVAWSALFVVIGAYLVHRLEANIYYILFSVIMFLCSIFVFIYARGERQNMATKSKITLPAFAMFNGFISSMFGIGGGVIVVPCLIFFLGFETKRATSTSQFVLVFTTLLGAIFLMNHIDFRMTLFMGIGVILGAQIGVLLSRKITGGFVQRIVALIMAIVAVEVFIKALL